MAGVSVEPCNPYGTAGQLPFPAGCITAQMKDLGLDLRQQARAEILTHEAMKTSEIEGERLNLDSVRSSVAQRLGLPTAGFTSTRDRQAEGVIDILLDATMNYRQDFTEVKTVWLTCIPLSHRLFRIAQNPGGFLT